MRKILLATNNKNKVRELSEIFNAKNIKIITPKEVGIDIEPIECGLTFEENAKIKAKSFSDEYCKITGEKILTLSEDSGLCIKALNMAPGVFTARWYKSFGKNYDENCDLGNSSIIEQVKGKDKTAYVIANFVLYNPYKDSYICSEGVMECIVSNRIKKDNGFLFDFILESKDLNKHLGECSLKEKNMISHRSKGIEGILNNKNFYSFMNEEV